MARSLGVETTHVRDVGRECMPQSRQVERFLSLGRTLTNINRSLRYITSEAFWPGSTRVILTFRWHRGCLRCTSCKTTLDASKVSDRDGAPYCKNCYAKVSDKPDENQMVNADETGARARWYHGSSVIPSSSSSSR